MHDEGCAVFVSGGTGYLGRELIPVLLARNHKVLALARPGSVAKLPAGCIPIEGSALNAASFQHLIEPCATLVHLVGVSHPSPWKRDLFRAVDLASLRTSVEAAKWAGIQHFIYVSVAHPAPVMKAYIEVRQECEAILKDSGIPANILRPWYVLGPGHRWPVVLAPLYGLLESLPWTKDGARRLGLVTLTEMVEALTWAVDNPPQGRRIMDVSAIRDVNRAQPPTSDSFTV